MLGIITKEVPIDDDIKTKLEFICDFCNVKPSFINGSIHNIERTNINYIEPNKVIIQGTTFLVFNHSKDVYEETSKRGECNRGIESTRSYEMDRINE